MVSPPLSAPPTLDKLQDFLTTAPIARIPIDSYGMGMLSMNLAQYFVVAKGQLAHNISACITSPLYLAEGSEHLTLIAENKCVVEVLLSLDSALSSQHRIGLVLQRDKADSTSLMTIKSKKGYNLRPDGVLRDIDGCRLLAKWENKGASHTMFEAVSDLREKTAAWTPLYYGKIEYLPCYAAAGSLLQFYAIPHKDLGLMEPRAISKAFNMSRLDDRAELAICAVNFYKLLAAQRKLYPTPVIPAAQDIVYENKVAGYKRTV